MDGWVIGYMDGWVACSSPETPGRRGLWLVITKLWGSNLSFQVPWSFEFFHGHLIIRYE